MVGVDRWSFYPFVEKMKRINAAACIDVLEKWWNEWGTSRILHSDNARAFVSQEFEDFLREHNVIHTTSSPMHSRSNMAERSIREIRALITKNEGNWKDVREALNYYRNTPRADIDASPAELFLGRQLRTKLPMLAGAGITKKEADALRKALKMKYELQTEEGAKKEKEMLQIGQRVRLYDPIKKFWNKKGRLIGIREQGRSYVVKDDDNAQYVRNRRFIKPLPTVLFGDNSEGEELTPAKRRKKEATQLEDASKKAVTKVRRSKRIADKRLERESTNVIRVLTLDLSTRGGGMEEIKEESEESEEEELVNLIPHCNTPTTPTVTTTTLNIEGKPTAREEESPIDWFGYERSDTEDEQEVEFKERAEREYSEEACRAHDDFERGCWHKDKRKKKRQKKEKSPEEREIQQVKTELKESLQRLKLKAQEVIQLETDLEAREQKLKEAEKVFLRPDTGQTLNNEMMKEEEAQRSVLLDQYRCLPSQVCQPSQLGQDLLFYPTHRLECLRPEAHQCNDLCLRFQAIPSLDTGQVQLEDSSNKELLLLSSVPMMPLDEWITSCERWVNDSSKSSADSTSTATESPNAQRSRPQTKERPRTPFGDTTISGQTSFVEEERKPVLIVEPSSHLGTAHRETPSQQRLQQVLVPPPLQHLPKTSEEQLKESNALQLNWKEESDPDKANTIMMMRLPEPEEESYVMQQHLQKSLSSCGQSNPCPYTQSTSHWKNPSKIRRCIISQEGKQTPYSPTCSNESQINTQHKSSLSTNTRHRESPMTSSTCSSIEPSAQKRMRHETKMTFRLPSYRETDSNRTYEEVYKMETIPEEDEDDENLERKMRKEEREKRNVRYNRWVAISAIILSTCKVMMLIALAVGLVMGVQNHDFTFLHGNAGVKVVNDTYKGVAEANTATNYIIPEEDRHLFTESWHYEDEDYEIETSTANPFQSQWNEKLKDAVNRERRSRYTRKKRALSFNDAGNAMRGINSVSIWFRRLYADMSRIYCGQAVEIFTGPGMMDRRKKKCPSRQKLSREEKEDILDDLKDLKEEIHEEKRDIFEEQTDAKKMREELEWMKNDIRYVTRGTWPPDTNSTLMGRIQDALTEANEELDDAWKETEKAAEDFVASYLRSDAN